MVTVVVMAMIYVHIAHAAWWMSHNGGTAMYQTDTREAEEVKSWSGHDPERNRVSKKLKFEY